MTPVVVQRSSPSTGRLRQITVAVAVLAGVLVVLAGIGLRESRHAVITVAPERTDIDSTVSAIGTVIPANDYPARATFSGLVDKIDVHLGQRVRPGDPLIELRDPYASSRVANAEAMLESAEVNRENVLNNGSQEDRILFAAELQHARDERRAASDALRGLLQLRARGSASDAEVAAGVLRMNNAKSSLDSLEKRVSERYSPSDVRSWQTRVKAEKQAVAAERASFDNAHLVSPIAGTVYLIAASLHDLVPAGGDMLHVANLSHLLVRADFNELDVGRLRVGQHVEIHWDGNSSRTWAGYIANQPLAVTPAGDRNVAGCLIVVDSARGDLPVNASVTAVVTVQHRSRVLTLPREAVHREDGRDYVYLVADGRLVKTPVGLGVINATRAEIATGLSDRDRVAVRSVDGRQLVNNMRITESR